MQRIPYLGKKDAVAVRFDSSKRYCLETIFDWISNKSVADTFVAPREGDAYAEKYKASCGRTQSSRMDDECQASCNCKSVTIGSVGS